MYARVKHPSESSSSAISRLDCLLLSVDEPAGEEVAESVTGQFHKRFSEQFDLTIEGKSIISRGIAAGEIPNEAVFGHYLFCIKDPDGNGITIYTSHVS